MEASMNVTQKARNHAAAQGNKGNNHTNEVISLQDDDGHVKVISQGLSFNDKACTPTSNTLSRHHSDHKNWFNKSALLLHVFLALLSLSLPAVQAEETCAKRPALHTIRYHDCIPKILLVPVCLGTCHSYSMTNDREPTTIQKWCNCCQESEHANRSVALRCPKPNDESGYMDAVIVMRVPTACMCRPCASVPEIQASVS